MPSEPRSRLRFLLDEHYPGWLAAELRADGLDVVSLTTDLPHLRGVDDTAVLKAAVAEGRVVVTEDVRTFGRAAAQVSNHLGILFCHHSRFPRTRPGLSGLRRALVELADSPPAGLGRLPVEWWVTQPAESRPR